MPVGNSTQKLATTGTLAAKKAAPKPAPATESQGAAATPQSGGNVLGFQRLLNSLLSTPPAGVNAAWFADTPSASANRLTYLNARLRDPAVSNALSPEVKAAFQSPNGQAWIKSLANDPNFLSLVKTTWKVSAPGVPDMPAAKVDNFRKAVGKTTDAQVAKLTQTLNDESLSESYMKQNEQTMVGSMLKGGNITPALI
jgi:hypothetical protein